MKAMERMLPELQALIARYEEERSEVPATAFRSAVSTGAAQRNPSRSVRAAYDTLCALVRTTRGGSSSSGGIARAVCVCYTIDLVISPPRARFKLA